MLVWLEISVPLLGPNTTIPLGLGYRARPNKKRKEARLRRTPYLQVTLSDERQWRNSRRSGFGFHGASLQAQPVQVQILSAAPCPCDFQYTGSCQGAGYRPSSADEPKRSRKTPKEVPNENLSLALDQGAAPS